MEIGRVEFEHAVQLVQLARIGRRKAAEGWTELGALPIQQVDGLDVPRDDKRTR